MATLAEFLKSEENQRLMLERIADVLRENGEWGTRGVYAKVGKGTGFSPAYVGQVFSGKKPLTDTFVKKLADHLGVPVPWLMGYAEEVDIKVAKSWGAELKRAEKSLREEWDQVGILIREGRARYPKLCAEFMRLPLQDLDEAVAVVTAIRKERLWQDERDREGFPDDFRYRLLSVADVEEFRQQRKKRERQ